MKSDRSFYHTVSARPAHPHISTGHPEVGGTDKSGLPRRSFWKPVLEAQWVMEPGMHRVSNPGSKARCGPGALAVDKLQGQARWGARGWGAGGAAGRLEEEPSSCQPWPPAPRSSLPPRQAGGPTRSVPGQSRHDPRPALSSD